MKIDVKGTIILLILALIFFWGVWSAVEWLAGMVMG